MRRSLALLLAFCLAFSLFGCNAAPQETQPTEPAPTTVATIPTEPAPSASDLYHEARKPIDEAANLELEITMQEEISIGQETFSVDSDQTLLLSGIGTEALQAQLTEEVSFNGMDDSFDEYYADGTLYTTVYDTYRYKGDMTQEDYLARFAPAVLLDSSLYQQIVSSELPDGTLVQFTEPSGPESWALPQGAEFISASGSARLDTEGTLVETTYVITYRYGAKQTTLTVTVSPTVKDTIQLTAPDDESAYIQLSYIDAPRVYDMAVMYLYATNAMTTVTTETIISYAAGCVRTQQSTVNYYGTGSDHVSEVTYDVSVMQGTSTDTYTQEERFLNGAYTLSADDAEPQSAQVSSEDMLSYCQEFLGENVIALDYISALEVSEAGGLLYMEMECTEEYGELLEGYANAILFDDETFLDNYASAYVTTECGGYMAVDLYTGFPTAVGITYSGSHTIDGEDYILSLQTDQSFNLASLSAYETIVGEPLPESEPEIPATPLFYHVTGEDGQEMWLLGTIHIGDERTAYLPQEIYAALEASDALAVEFDGQAFEDALDTDDELVSQISEYYFYSDGSTTKDHLDEEIYEEAVKLLKASGSYNANAEYMKPYLWSQSIDNFYLQLGYNLVSEKGVDNRLMDLARERDMQILDIESGLFQIGMMTGFSEELQALLLEEALSYNSAEYCADTAELYEKWCAGDEAELREALSDEVDTSEFTEEELAEYEEQLPLIEEYNKAMSYDRNDGMLAAAIEYLESGDVVFYAVGLAHLLNNVNGLVDTLREAGYTVELVTYDHLTAPAPADNG